MAEPCTEAPAKAPALDSQTSRSTSHVLIWILALLVLYVLSIGPVARLDRDYYFTKTPGVSHIINVFYAPLIYAHENSQIGQKFFDWYFDLFGVK